MTRDKLTKQLELMHKDLCSANKRSRRISKECGLEDNELIAYAMEQTKEILEYIGSLKEKDSVDQKI